MHSFLLLPLLALALAGCGASSAPDDAQVPTTSGNEKDDVLVPGASEPTTSDDASGDARGDPKTGPATPGPSFGCRLPAPVSSDDACSKDTDCAPSTPCHARACVAVSKATPRTPDSVCTMNIDCQSADVNPCSCYQGRCALVPKNP